MDLNSAGFAVFPAEFNRDLLVVATYAQIMTCLLVFTQTRTCSGEYMSTVVLALRAHRIQGTVRENGNFPRVLLGTLSGHI